MNEQQNVQIIQDIYAAFGRGDMDTILNALAPDIDWFIPGSKEIPYSGHRCNPQEVKACIEQMVTTLEIQRFEARKFEANNDEIIVVGFERMKVKATGRVFENDWIQIWSLKDSRVIRFREFFNTDKVLHAFKSD